jgi:hypothetical protein
MYILNSRYTYRANNIREIRQIKLTTELFCTASTRPDLVYLYLGAELRSVLIVQQSALQSGGLPTIPLTEPSSFSFSAYQSNGMDSTSTHELGDS